MLWYVKFKQSSFVNENLFFRDNIFSCWWARPWSTAKTPNYCQLIQQLYIIMLSNLTTILVGLLKVKDKKKDSKILDVKKRWRKEDRKVTEGDSGIIPLHLGDRQTWMMDSGCHRRQSMGLEKWLWTVRLKAQMTVMSVITAFTLAGGHKVLYWLCQSRESPWRCVCASLHNAYIVSVCLQKSGWLTLYCFWLYVRSVEKKGLFLPAAAAQTVSQSVHLSVQGLRNLVQFAFCTKIWIMISKIWHNATKNGPL